MLTTVPRFVIALIGVAALGVLIADVIAPETARRHLRNPRWPPHAKFHNGQGVVMGVDLSLLTPWLLFGAEPQFLSSLTVGAISTSLYRASMLIAIRLSVRFGATPCSSKHTGRECLCRSLRL